MKKEKVFITVLIFILFLVIILYYNQPKIVEVVGSEKSIIPSISKEKVINYKKYINDLKNTYHNSDVVALVKIPDVLEEPIVQTTDNDYYLHYDIYKNQNIIGASFLDYRNHLTEDKKLLIYGHSDPEGQLPFVQISNYNNRDFFNANPYIYLIDSSGERKYEVFSSYIETKDFDYVNLESFNGLTYKEHLEKLKKKSFVGKNIELEESSRVLVLQTCSFDERVQANPKYQIVVTKEVEKVTK